MNLLPDGERLRAIFQRYPDIEYALEFRPMEYAPLDPNIWILVCTTHGNIEPAHYMADGDFKDRWGRENVRFQCLGWLPITAVAPKLDHRLPGRT
jgi:hypothetical protein